MIVRTLDDGRIEALAPAKVNLYLEVLGKRPDGYHEIETLMVATDLFDELTFCERPSGAILVRCDVPDLPTGPENLVVQAAERLRDRAKVNRGAEIELRKAIPAQAGLAGGSSDAATTIACLDRLWDLDLGSESLDAVASEVGSDVSFFLHAPAAVCRGRGEKITALALDNPLFLVLVCPTVGVSTADVYRNLTLPDRPRSIAPALEALRSKNTASLGRTLFNRLQPVAEQLVPDLARVRVALQSLVPSHLDGHLMSGSGSAYFGLARDRDAATAAARQLETLGLGRVRVVTCGP